MRVLYFNKVAAAVQGERNQYVLDVTSRLREFGVEIALVHGRKPASQYRGIGYVYDYLEYGAKFSEQEMDGLEAIVEDFLPDVIQLHGTENFRLQEWLCERFPTVRFIHNHQFYCSGGDMTRSYPRKICHRVHGKGCLLRHGVNHCGSYNPIKNLQSYQRVNERLAALRGLHGIQVASPVLRENLIHNGVSGDKIEYFPLYAPAPVVKKRNYRMARRIILHPGGLVKNKGVWLMLKAMPHLPEDVNLVFAGGGDQQERLLQQIKAKNLQNRVQILGELENEALSELYHQAEFVVFPSRWNEPVGLSGIQAMAHGKAVVAFDSEGVRGWLKPGVTGELVKFNDERGFIQVVGKLLTDPRRLLTMGRAAKEHWEAEFQPKRHIAHLVEYYQRIHQQWKSQIGGKG